MNRLTLLALVASLFLAYHADADPVVAKLKDTGSKRVYAKVPITLDGSESTQGAGVTYQWTVKYEPSIPQAPAVPAIVDADKAVAQFTPPCWGAYNFILTVTQGTDTQTAHTTLHVMNDPAKDDTPTFDGENKVLYKQAPDALGGTAKLYLHIFNPTDWKATDKRAAVIMFHGGGWGQGSPDRYVPDARYWATRGAVGIAPQYRLGVREGMPPPECVADAKSAVRYVRAHAAELGIDPQKIAVGGESAGAHIAACTGTLTTYDDPKDDLSVSCVPNALVLEFPYSMITTVGNKKDDMSPLHFVTPKTPPTIFIAGEQDGIAPAERGKDWGNQMQGGGNEFRYFIYRRAHHPSGHQDMTKPGQEDDMIRQEDLFLEKLGFLTGAPTVPAMDDAAIAALHVDPATFVPVQKGK